MTYLEYDNIKLNIIDGYEITESSQEVTFNSIRCDFTGYTVDDLPDKYQEVRVVENGNILFFGYIDDFSFSGLREKDVEREIEITLLSPLKLATLRTVIINGTYSLKNLIEEILEPLIEDGFIINEMNITDRQITVNYPLNTVEYCMNNLSNKFNFWWFIDEKKNIHIKNIDQMLKYKADYIYDDNNTIPYLQYIKPTAQSEGYANVVNFKNVRIYENSYINFQGSTITSKKNELIDSQIQRIIKKDDQIEFAFPCDIKKENIIKSAKSNGLREIDNSYYYGLLIRGVYSDNSNFEIYIRNNNNDGTYSISSNIGFDSNESDKNKEFLLIKDSFFDNLITGIKYNNESKNITRITEIRSDSILVYNIYRMYNDGAIHEKKGIISDTGIVETTVDMNESWKTLEELRDIGSSYMNKNSLKMDCEIELKVDTFCSIKIGNTIKINKMYFNDTYIVTKIQQSVKNNEKEWLIECSRGNVLNNYIDIFRGENTQDNDEKVYKTTITHYVEENIKETFEVIK